VVDATAGAGNNALVCKFTSSVAGLIPKNIGVDCKINSLPYYSGQLVPSVGTPQGSVSVSNGANSITLSTTYNLTTNKIDFVVKANTITNTGSF
jgi:hypothetical protein